MSSRHILFINVSEEVSGSLDLLATDCYVRLIQLSFFGEAVVVVGLIPECP